LTRSGHVYIISNIGSFGDQVFKIGMTRRLDPMDRVRELGDASVPFHFDVHAIIYSTDAPRLEATLHRMFNNRRVNRVNERKEFFRVSIDEIAQAVRQHHGEIEIVRECEAADYRKTLAIMNDDQNYVEEKIESVPQIAPLA
jgi:Meiotically up-regulated gene 113